MVRTGRPDRCGARPKRLRGSVYVKDSLTGDYIRAAAATNRIGFLTLSDEQGIGRDNHDRYTGLSASAPLRLGGFVIRPLFNLATEAAVGGASTQAGRCVCAASRPGETMVP